MTKELIVVEFVCSIVRMA